MTKSVADIPQVFQLVRNCCTNHKAQIGSKDHAHNKPLLTWPFLVLMPYVDNTEFPQDRG